MDLVGLNSVNKPGGASENDRSGNKQSWLRAFESESFDDFGEKSNTKLASGRQPLFDDKFDKNNPELAKGDLKKGASQYTESLNKTVDRPVRPDNQVEQFLMQQSLGTATNRSIDVAYMQSLGSESTQKGGRSNAGVAQRVFESLDKEHSEFREVNVHLSEVGDKRTLMLRNFFADSQQEKLRWVERLRKLFEAMGEPIDEIIINGKKLDLVKGQYHGD